MRVGNTVRFVEEFYSDPYQYVPVLEVYDELGKMGVSGGGKEFEDALRDTVGQITRYNNKDHVWVEVELFEDVFELLVDVSDITLTQMSIEDNTRRAKLEKLEYQEKAGQMRLF